MSRRLLDPTGKLPDVVFQDGPVSPSAYTKMQFEMLSEATRRLSGRPIRTIYISRYLNILPHTVYASLAMEPFTNCGFMFIEMLTDQERLTFLNEHASLRVLGRGSIMIDRPRRSGLMTDRLSFLVGAPGHLFLPSHGDWQIQLERGGQPHDQFAVEIRLVGLEELSR